MIDETFRASVKTLFVPEMGTESTAELLYWLIRTVRPERVLEVGMGYTTPFLARAVKDNAEAAAAERSLFQAGTADAELPWPDATFYRRPFEPRLICVDRMTDPTSSAPQVVAVLEELGLTDSCEVVATDLRDAAEEIRSRFGLVDFAWIDTWDTLAFLRDFWELINPAGGFLAIHYLMSYPEGRAILRYVESLRARDGNRLEVTNFREPHKTVQNSLTLIRRVRDYVDAEDLRPDGNSNDPIGVLGL